ncbi:MAG TPA: hypothetical protein VH593_11725 [Ktedonobacteraceae bacterium]|jgi:hypothetical protein
MEWLRKIGRDKTDPHDEPTEPVPDLDDIPTALLAPPSPYISQKGPDAPTEVYIPGQGADQRPYPSFQQPYSPGFAGPAQQQIQGPWGQPGGGQNGPVTDQAGKQRQGTLLRAFPILVGLCFISIQFLLLFRFVLKLLDVMTNQGLVGTIYGVSDLFVLPFALFWQQIPLKLPAQIEVYTLVAIIGYGIISRIVVRSLKLIIIPRLSRKFLDGSGNNEV